MPHTRPLHAFYILFLYEGMSAAQGPKPGLIALDLLVRQTGTRHDF